MYDIKQLLANNRAWSITKTQEDPNFFSRLVAQQKPGYLWIGCSDSRVPATQLVGLLPGEMFVHRNVANVVVHTDLNCLSVVHYAVDVLAVQHIIVCGHYGCGGVTAAFHNTKLGLIDNWLRHVQDVRQKHAQALARCRDETQQLRLLCALNVVEQVVNVCETTIVQQAWERGQALAVHGWIYTITNGLIDDLFLCVDNPTTLEQQYTDAVAAIVAAELGRATA